MISFPAGRGRGVGPAVSEQSSDSSPSPPASDHDDVQDMQQDSEQGSQQPGARRQSKADATTRKPCIRDNEDDLADWFSSHRELWYRGDSKYHMTSVKEATLDAKAKEISTVDSKCTGK